MSQDSQRNRKSRQRWGVREGEDFYLQARAESCRSTLLVCVFSMKNEKVIAENEGKGVGREWEKHLTSENATQGTYLGQGKDSQALFKTQVNLIHSICSLCVCAKQGRQIFKMSSEGVCRETHPSKRLRVILWIVTQTRSEAWREQVHQVTMGDQGLTCHMQACWERGSYRGTKEESSITTFSVSLQ